jgi:hypothetical protein
MEETTPASVVSLKRLPQSVADFRYPTVEASRIFFVFSQMNAVFIAFILTPILYYLITIFQVYMYIYLHAYFAKASQAAG